MDEPPESSHAAISTPMSVPEPARPRPPEPRPRRRRWLPVVAASAFVAACAAGYGVVRALSPAPRAVFGVAPIGAGQAILLTRRTDPAEPTAWVELVESDGTVAWRKDVSPLLPSEAGGFSGVTASADRVIVMGAHHGSTAVKALDRRTGEVVWQTLVAERVAPERVGAMLLVDGPRVYAIHTRASVDGRAAERITALTLEGGTAVWTMDLPKESVEVVVLGPRRLVIAMNGGVEEIDGATGAVLRALPITRIACATPSGVIGFDLSAHVALVHPPTPDGDRAAAVTEIDRNGAAGPCGTRGEDIVFSTRSGDGGTRHGLMRLEPESGSLRWALDLGPVSFGANEAADGRLPRFLPVVVAQGGESKVVVVDLDTGARVAEHPVSVGHALATEDRGWVVAGPTLVALEPSSGALDRATELPVFLSRGTLTLEEDMRFGALWLIRYEGERAAGDLRWMAIDLKTARALHENGDVAARDVTASGWPAP